MRYRIYDMHCHLDFMTNARAVAAEAASAGVGLLCATVTPAGHAEATGLGELDNVWVGAGLHPWWLSDGRCDEADAARAAALARSVGIVAEVGMDFSRRHGGDATRELQEQAFGAIATSCAEAARLDGTPRLLSLHAVQAAGRVLDILDASGCLDHCNCVFHWFSGTGPELARARDAGCFFSLNEMMLATRRGREYARQLPEAQILLETDLPPKEGEDFPAVAFVAQLERTLAQLAEIRRVDTGRLGEAIAATSAHLLAAH